MRAGKLRHRFKVQAALRYRDVNGTSYNLWHTETTRWGGIAPQNGREFKEAAAINSSVTHLVKLRAIDSDTFPVQSVMRLVRNDTQILNIISAIRNEEVREEYKITCIEDTGIGLTQIVPDCSKNLIAITADRDLVISENGSVITDVGASGAPSTRVANLPDPSLSSVAIDYEALVTGLGLRFVATNGARIQLATELSSVNGYLQATDNGSNLTITRVSNTLWVCSGNLMGWSVG